MASDVTRHSGVRSIVQHVPTREPTNHNSRRRSATSRSPGLSEHDSLSRPFRTMCTEKSNGQKYVLVCVDHAIRYIDAVAVPSTAAHFYVDYLLNRWIPRFGVPTTIVTDQAKSFVNKQTAALYRRLGITHVTSPPYWPQANGLVERMVGTLKNIIRKLIEPHQNWEKILPEAVFSVNVSRQSSSRFSPFELMHGYVPKLPGQLNIGTVEADLDETTRLHRLARQRHDAKNNLENSQASAKGRHDARTPFTTAASERGQARWTRSSRACSTSSPFRPQTR